MTLRLPTYRLVSYARRVLCCTPCGLHTPYLVPREVVMCAYRYPTYMWGGAVRDRCRTNEVLKTSVVSLYCRSPGSGASALLLLRAAVARRRRRPPGPPGECARSTDARARCHELPTVCDGRPRLILECGAEAPPQGLAPQSCPQAQPEADALRPLLRRVLMT